MLKSYLKIFGITMVLCTISFSLGVFIGKSYDLPIIDSKKEKILIVPCTKEIKINPYITEKKISGFIRKENRKIYEKMAKSFAKYISDSSKKYKIPLMYIVSLISIESDFRFSVKSDKGAIGLMQINPKVWVKILKENGIINHKMDLYDPKKNISCGCFILKHYMKKKSSNSLKYALTRYLGGTKNSHYENFLYALGKYITHAEEMD